VHQLEVHLPRHEHQWLLAISPQKKQIMGSKLRLKLLKAAAVFTGLHFAHEVEDAQIASVLATSRATERYALAWHAGVLRLSKSTRH
jgi:hypothetical protein